MASLVAWLGTTACSDPITTPETGGDAPGQPVAKPDAPASKSTDFRTYAVNDLRLGLSDRSGKESDTAWKSYGFNLDKLKSTENSKDVCKGDTSVRTDGDNGIDNAFGRKIAPSLKLASPTFETTLNDAIKGGGFTIMFDVKGLTGESSQSATALSGSVFGGGLFGMGKTPFTSTTEDWPVSKDSLVDGATLTSGAKVTFTDAYVNKGTFVARAAEVLISVQLGGKPLNLRLRKAVIQFKVNGADASEGTLAGVLNAAEFVTELKRVAPYLSTMFCSSASLLDSFAAAADILSDATNSPTKDCDGISVGLGFTAKQVGRPARVDNTVEPVIDPCAGDAGGTAGH